MNLREGVFIRVHCGDQIEKILCTAPTCIAATIIGLVLCSEEMLRLARCDETGLVERVSEMSLRAC